MPIPPRGTALVGHGSEVLGDGFTAAHRYAMVYRFLLSSSLQHLAPPKMSIKLCRSLGILIFMLPMLCFTAPFTTICFFFE
jgi:hypothetical protein